MKKLTLLLVCSQLLLVACAEPLSKGTIAGQDQAAILGGKTVPRDSKLSKMAVLIESKMRDPEPVIQNGSKMYRTRRTICTGAFITPNIVMTAAHCIKEAPYKMRIIYSENMADPTARYSLVEKAVVHTDYKAEDSSSKSDIALIKIQGEIPSDYPVMSLTTMSAANSAFPILSIGYGKTDESKTDWGVLRRVLSTATGYVPQNPIFTIDQSNDTGICSGDSGGPGFYLKDGNYSIIGVATAIYDLESDTKNRPCRHYGVYTNVLYYADWMLKTITKLNGKSNAEQ